jgi:hypothetical protein
VHGSAPQTSIEETAQAMADKALSPGALRVLQPRKPAGPFSDRRLSRWLVDLHDRVALAKILGIPPRL